MTYGDVTATVAVLVDIGILVILIMEYNYDKIVYERSKFRNVRRKKFDFDRLTIGEMQ